MARVCSRFAVVSVLGFAGACAVVGACSTFSSVSPEGATDGGGEGDAAGDEDAGFGENAPDAPNTPESSSGGTTLFADDFDSMGCGGWLAKHGAALTAIAPGNNGSPGACELCVESIDPDGGVEPFVEKTFASPPAGTYRATGYFRAPANGTSPHGGNRIGLQFDYGQTAPAGETSEVSLGPAWVSATTLSSSPTGTTLAHVTIEIGGSVGTCLDFDDVTVNVTRD